MVRFLAAIMPRKISIHNWYDVSVFLSTSVYKHSSMPIFMVLLKLQTCYIYWALENIDITHERKHSFKQRYTFLNLKFYTPFKLYFFLKMIHLQNFQSYFVACLLKIQLNTEIAKKMQQNESWCSFLLYLVIFLNSKFYISFKLFLFLGDNKPIFSQTIALFDHICI